jgi:hypothetical protein
MPPSQLTVPDDLTFTSNSKNMLALKGTATPAAAVVYAPSSAVNDADLSPNTIAPSIDETNHALVVRAEYANGTTLKTATIPFQPASTITVGATGADFTSIQAAWNSLKGRLLQSAVTIAVQPGTYTEAVVLRDQPYASLIKIQGDTRTAAGSHMPTTGSITKSGSNCTITLVSAPPSDFTSSDYVVIGGAASAANVGRFPIVSIDVPNKTVTYTNASGVAEAVRIHTQVIFCPNRIIDFTGLGIFGIDAATGGGTSVAGFTLLSTATTTAHGIRVADATLIANGVCVFGIHDSGYAAIQNGALKTNGNCTAVKCAYGFHAVESGSIQCDNTYAADHTIAGYRNAFSGFVRAINTIATNSVVGYLAQIGGVIEALPGAASFNTDGGFKAEDQSVIYAYTSTAKNNGTGYASNWNSLIAADSTSANNSGNTTNYSPATSGTEGNFAALIRWS